jgi:hypothetical protein
MRVLLVSPSVKDLTDGSLWESSDKGATFTRVLSGFGTRTSSSGRAIPYRPFVYGHASNPQLVLLATAAGLYRRTARNSAPTLVYTSTVPLISVSAAPANASLVYIIGAHQVLSSTNGGTSFSTLGVPAALAAQTFTTIIALADRLFLSTDHGVFIYGLTGAVWGQLTAVPPAVFPALYIPDMEYNALDDVLAVATLGRGAWTLPAASTVALPTLVKKRYAPLPTCCPVTHGLLTSPLQQRRLS